MFIAWLPAARCIKHSTTEDYNSKLAFRFNRANVEEGYVTQVYIHFEVGKTSDVFMPHRDQEPPESSSEVVKPLYQ
jgi:hypothetical protein